MSKSKKNTLPKLSYWKIFSKASAIFSRFSSIQKKNKTQRKSTATFITLQTTNDGNTTRSVLSFIASKEDAGRRLSCHARNPIMKNPAIEDDWILTIHCKQNSRQVAISRRRAKNGDTRGGTPSLSSLSRRRWIKV